MANPEFFWLDVTLADLLSIVRGGKGVFALEQR